MKILAHRANLHGPAPQTENTAVQVDKALELGFGVETDIRRATDGTLYISHDPAPATAENDGETHALLWTKHADRQIALNVKELGYSQQLVDYIQRHSLHRQVFLFDFELLEKQAGTTAAEVNQLDSRIRLAARVSDRYGETIEQAASIDTATIIWLDEFDSLWVTQEHIDQLKELERTIFAISPEIHGFTPSEAETRWQQFQHWGIDGICTDFPIRAREVLHIRNQ